MADSKAFSVDTTAPSTSISDLQVSGSTASVLFSSAASDVARFECRLDGGTYATCTSPKQFTALAEGSHTVSVRAVDNAGNVGAADSKTFTVDTIAPNTSITGAPVSGSTATVSFSSPASDVARFECRLDGGTYATCTSPKQFSALTEGEHTVSCGRSTTPATPAQRTARRSPSIHGAEHVDQRRPGDRLDCDGFVLERGVGRRAVRVPC